MTVSPPPNSGLLTKLRDTANRSGYSQTMLEAADHIAELTRKVEVAREALAEIGAAAGDRGPLARDHDQHTLQAIGRHAFKALSELGQ